MTTSESNRSAQVTATLEEECQRLREKIAACIDPHRKRMLESALRYRSNMLRKMKGEPEPAPDDGEAE